MRISFSIFLIIQLAPCWGQLYFNNVYDRPDFLAEWCGQVEVVDDKIITPVWFWELDETSNYGIRELDFDGNEIMVSSVDSVYYWFSGGLAQNFKQTTDGGYIYGGMLDTACIIKITPDYQLEWRTNVGEFLGSMRSVSELANGQFFCTWNHLQGTNNGIGLYWYNSDGSVANNLDYILYGQGIYEVNSVNQLSNGDLLLTMYFDEYLSDDPPIHYFDNIIARLNSETGEVVWQERYSIGNFNKQLGWMQAIVENDTTATLCYITRDTLLDPFNAYGASYGSLYAAKLNLNTGDTSAVVLIEEGIGNHQNRDFEKCPDGGYVILMTELPNDIVNTYMFQNTITKIDSNFQFEWKKQYAPLPISEIEHIYHEAFDIDICPDSGFVVSGYAQDTNSEPTFHNGKQIPWVFKTDYCGELEWNNCGVDNIAESHAAPLGSASVFPNPASDKITVSSSQEFESITIRDITGKSVYTSTMSNHLLQTQLDISSLANGLYLIEVDFGERRVGAQKLVVE
jgi:Secretion system C-terminal sorting domain